jgi:hypothetical protein
MVCWSMTHIQMCGYLINCYAAIFFHDGFNCCNDLSWPDRGETAIELMPFRNFLVHPYACCSDRHASPYWTFIRRWISMGFTPISTLFLFAVCCKRDCHFYTTTAPSFCIPASYCHLSATLQTVWLLSTYRQSSCVSDFYDTLKFSFDSPSYLITGSLKCAVVRHIRTVL